MQPTFHQIPNETVNLGAYVWGTPTPGQPSVVFFHATGFHARCWDAIIRRLDGVHCIAADARGHGQSAKPAPPYSWQQLGADAAAVIRHFALENVIGVGHSMGGNSVVRAAASLPGVVRALVLVDPVIFPRGQYTETAYSIDGHFVLNRRREWASPDEMFASFKGRGPFATWEDEILQDYCDYGLLPTETGYLLACPPEVEAHIYSGSRLQTAADIYDAVAQITAPVKILRCTQALATGPTQLSASPTAPNLADQFATGTDIPLPNNTHFIPMETPALVADHIRAFVNGEAV